MSHDESLETFEGLDLSPDEGLEPLPQVSKPQSQELSHELVRDESIVTNGRPSIIVEIPRKTADYYRDFQEVNLAMLLKDEPFEVLFTLGDTPKSFKQAIQSPFNKEWLKAMGLEVTELEDQKCWELVSLPEGKNALGGR